ncbi:MOSC domain-containing protein [Desulfobacterales bacterium HSG17]|nr:MOSC domain-containing protein [Desulfobacterales bacterium HSG17]
MEIIGEIVSIAISPKKKTPKKCIKTSRLIENHGLADDAHAGEWHRQVSFLAAESIEKAKDSGLSVGFGDFAENIATRGIDWPEIPVGTRFQMGSEAILEITQIGKTCHTRCAIYYQAGDCIMPTQGVFARVLTGGGINVGDVISACP